MQWFGPYGKHLPEDTVAALSFATERHIKLYFDLHPVFRSLTKSNPWRIIHHSKIANALLLVVEILHLEVDDGVDQTNCHYRQLLIKGQQASIKHGIQRRLHEKLG